MWQPLDRNNALLLLYPKAFSEMGIRSALFAAGLCDASTIYKYEICDKIHMVIFLLWKLKPSFCEVKIWIAKGFPRQELIDALNKFEPVLISLGVKYAYLTCNHWPLKRLAKAVGVKSTQLPVGTKYEWEKSNAG